MDRGALVARLCWLYWRDAHRHEHPACDLKRFEALPLGPRCLLITSSFEPVRRCPESVTHVRERLLIWSAARNR